ncbi:AAA family ATPase [Paenarthrobacter sp. DKR-5]|uniref:helix-turn-helix transcriptional regulator n=1 Tax=Paenarthrobacter sp. DKR-5 TaxID=2835535 RepID=UPI001BDCBE01|nr:LuxR C-terminal-related transcriptional regulator [Paenarthrobacter sp. DKR-5]MBT1002459.1 AAA family ATPase [Paenarthrobacter sp. DKR-5]
MTASYARGPFVGRAALVEELIEAVGRQRGRGAILVGPAGVGKTSLALRALEQASDKAAVVRVHGSSAVSGLSYGALRSLLQGASPEVFEQPVLLMRALTKQLQARGNGKQVILFVDNAQQLDDLGAMALRQLVIAGTVTLLAVCEDLPKVRGELMSLWRDGLLTRIDVGPFDLAETTDWLAAHLGAPVSRAAAQALWDASSGNPLLLKMLLQAQVDARTLVDEQGVWVLAGTLVHSPQIVHTVMATLGQLSLSEKRALETAALSQALPLELLLQSTDRRAVDSLQTKGLLQVERTAPPLVRVKRSLTAEVIRGQIPPGRRQELREGLMEAMGSAAVPAVGTLALTSCALDCAVELDAETLITAARLANRLDEPRNALRFLAAVPGQDQPAAALVEKAAALLAVGENAAAANVLAHAERAGGGTALDAVQLRILRSRLLRASTEGWRDAASALAGPGAEERGAGPVDGQDEGTSLLQLAGLELAAYQGRYTDIEDGLFTLFTRGCTADIRLRAGALLFETWAISGLQGKAERLAVDLSVQLERPEVLPHTRHEVQARLFTAFLTTGIWEQCDRSLAAGAGSAGVADLRQATANQLWEGVLQAYRGNAERALEHLRPAVSQLRVTDPDGSLLLATAAAGYAYALAGEKNLSLDCLGEFKRCGGHASWLVRSTARYFATLASAELASRELAIERLVAQADAARERGAIAQELRLLSGAVRLGGLEWVARLAGVAHENQGHFAQICLLYASGLENSNPGQLLRALQTATVLADDGFAGDIARATADMAKETGDRDTLHTARQFLQASARRCGGVDLLHGDIQILTARELEVAADVISGASNRAIAAKMNVSVRTVEGHLYKIYGKLNITSRAELREVLAS